MKAPDKIYTTPVGTFDTKHIPDLQDNIYIRKDTLLEWAKETYLNESASAIRKVCYKQLIDKLNSM